MRGSIFNKISDWAVSTRLKHGGLKRVYFGFMTIVTALSMSLGPVVNVGATLDPNESQSAPIPQNGTSPTSSPSVAPSTNATVPSPDQGGDQSRAPGVNGSTDGINDEAPFYSQVYHDNRKTDRVQQAAWVFIGVGVSISLIIVIVGFLIYRSSKKSTPKKAATKKTAKPPKIKK